MNITQFLAILAARKWVALGVLLLTVATAVAVSLILPKQYIGRATVLVDAKPDPIASALIPERASVSSTYVLTQVDILKSVRVAQRVVRNAKLTERPDIREGWIASTGGVGSIETWLIESFQKNLEVLPSTDSNVISVNYTAGDPAFAADMANAFVTAYLQTSLELRVNPARQYSGFFEERTKEARDRLEQAQSKLSAFQRERGIIASDERLDIENARLNELSQQLVLIQALAAETSSRQNQVASGGDRMSEVLSNPLITQLKADMSRNEAKLQELTARLGDQHPEVIQAKANIGELRARIEAETRRVTGSVNINANVNRGREAQIAASLENQRVKVLKLKQVRDEGSLLLRDVESAQKVYDTVLARLNQSSLESQANQSTAYMLTQAVAPSKESSPNLILNVALAVFIGALLALGTALMMEMLDRRVRGPLDVVYGLELPIIGVMPKPTARRLMGRKSVPLMQQRVLGQLPAASKGA